MRIAVVSYPKSGRTWLRYIAHLAGLKLRFRHCGTGTAKLDEVGKTDFKIDDKIKEADKIVFLERHPIDTAVSLYFQVHNRDFHFLTKSYFKKSIPFYFQSRLPPRRMARFLKHPGYGVEKVVRFNAWAKEELLKLDKELLCLKYENLRTEPHVWIAHFLEFCAPSHAFDVADIVAKSDFAEIQQVQQEAVENERKLLNELRLFHGKDKEQDSMKVRRGVIGGYKDYLTPEEQAYFEKMLEAVSSSH